MTAKSRTSSPTEPSLASRFLRVVLGSLLLFATVGLTTCQSFFGSFYGSGDNPSPVKASQVG